MNKEISKLFKSRITNYEDVEYFEKAEKAGNKRAMDAFAEINRR